MTKQKLEAALVIRRRPEEEKKMVEYVEREVVVGAVVRAVDAGLAITSRDLEDIIRDLHVAEVAPVAHGRWVDAGDGFGICNLCNTLYEASYNYCPNCGAKMDREGTK